MFFQISPVRIEKKKKLDTPEKITEEEIEVLSLAPFSSIPKLTFNNIKVGSVATCQLLIKNPTNQEINLFLSRLLPEELNVSYSWKNNLIESGGETIFKLTWCPSEEESSRHIISFTDTKKIKRDIPITFKSISKKPTVANKVKSTKARQISPSKKITKKYYPTRPTNISPRKQSTPPRRNPANKKYSPSPAKNVSPIHKKHSRSTSENPPAKCTYRNKENIPSSFLDTSRASDVFVSPKNISFTLDCLQTVRRETYVLKNTNKTSPKDEFEDSLEKISPSVSPIFLSTSTRTPLGVYNAENFSLGDSYSQHDFNVDDFASKLNKNSFFLTPSTTPVRKTVPLPIQIETLSVTSLVGDISRNRTYDRPGLNISGETYIKCNTSSDTYVKGNISGATYTRDSSVGDLNSLNVSPFSLKISPGLHPRRCSSPYTDTDKVKKSSQPIVFGERQELSRIDEESCVHSSRTFYNTTKRRKLDAELSVTSPKKPLPCSAKDWSRKGGTALRVSKKSTGLNVRHRVGKENKEAVLEISKRDANVVVIQNPFILAATNLADPFMTPNLYVSEQWVDQQEADLKKWLNALLTPPKELSAEERVIDVAKVWQECKKREADEVADKETVCNNAKLNNLRKAAQSLFRSGNVGAVLSKVMQAVDSGKLSIRTDKDIHLNLILKSEIINLLLSYNSLWLRIALETIYNEIIPLSSNSDIVGLSTFIVNRLIKDPYLVRKYKSVHSPKYASEFKKFFLKKFLILVYFLDQAKNQKLIAHDPCLFRKNGGIKESKDLLVRLARETLFAVGDITKSLKFLGYVVTHEQTYIHEFDYTVAHLGVDLRDGVRLSKIMEIIIMRNDLLDSLRVPAISRLQKIHNMKIVFEALNKAGFKILYDITPKDIVDGHREKTLSFLWQIIYKFEAPLMVKSATTIQKWFRSTPVMVKRKQLGMIRTKRENAAKKIQRWYKWQTLSRKIDWFIGFYKREQAAVKIQSYYRKHLCQTSYNIKLQTIINVQRICRGYLVRNINTAQIKSAVVIQKNVRMFIARKQFLQLKRSTLIIQARYRAHRAMTLAKTAYDKLKSAATLIQRKYRETKLSRDQRQRYLRLKRAVLSLQTRFRANRLCRLQRHRYAEIKSAATKIQTRYRLLRAVRSARDRYLRLKRGVAVVEQRFLALKAMRAERRNYLLVKTACLSIQQRYRARLAMRIERNKFVELKAATVLLQRRYRANRAMEHDLGRYRSLRDAAVFVQRRFRANESMRLDRKRFVETRTAAIKIQSWFRATSRMRVCRTNYLSLKYATRIFEDRYEARALMKKKVAEYRGLKTAALLLQRKYRARAAMRAERQKFCRLKSATIAIQRRFRANKVARSRRLEYSNLKRAVGVVQRRFRAQREMRTCLNEFVQLKKTVVMLQRRVRANNMMVIARNSYKSLLKHVVFVQQTFRANRLAKLHRTNYLKTKQAAVVIQSRFRAQRSMRTCLNKFVLLKKTTVMLQRRFRANNMMIVARDTYKSLLKHVVYVQRVFRANRLAKLHRTNYLKTKQAAVVIQRRFRAQRDMRTCLNKYVVLKKTTVMLQRRVRANNMMIIARNSYRSLLKHTISVQQIFRANRLAKLHRTNYLRVKEAAVVVQSRFRAQKNMRTCLNEFVLLKKTTVMLQRKIRANNMMIVARDSYKSLLKHVVYVQRVFRANRLAKLHRTNYLKTKQAAVVIQKRFRAQRNMRTCLNKFVLLKKTTVMLQRRIRANNMMIVARDSYKSLLKHVVFVQRLFRANRLAELHRTNYLKLKQAAVTIQIRFRAQRDMQTCLYKFVLLRKTTVMLQRKFRARQLMKAARDSYTSLKKAAITIQRRWRARKLSEKARDGFLRLKGVVVLVQQRWRAKKMGLKDKQHFDAVKGATVIIQRWWRALKLARQVRNEYRLLKTATLTVQHRWRAIISMRLHSRNYAVLRSAVIILQRRYRAQVSMKKQLSCYKRTKHAVICIQRFYRGYLEMKMLVAEYESKKNAIIRIQSHIKGYNLRRKYAHYFTIEAKEQRKIDKQRTQAALRIQANWRGFKSRSSEPYDCAKIRKRMQKANADVVPENTLGSKYGVALQTFANKNSTLFHIIKALQDIDYVTRRCESKCIEMSQLLPDQLYIMLGATSRSLPEMNACIYSVNILINICKCPATKKYSFVPEYIDNLLAVMLHWCDKESQLFPTLCTLLWLFAHAPQWKRIILRLPNIAQRLKRIQSMVSRKESMVKRSVNKAFSHFAPSKHLPMPSLVPDWGLDYSNNPNVFTNSVHALDSLLSILNI